MFLSKGQISKPLSGATELKAKVYLDHGFPLPLVTPFTVTNFYVILGIYLRKISIRAKCLLTINPMSFILKQFGG